jgi:hypothetical protein
MNDTRLQGWIDELHDTSGQQWGLRLIALVAPLGAMASVAAEIGRWWWFGLAVVVALALASAFRPDSYTAVILIAVVAWHWLATVDRIGTIWLPVATCCLLVYHSVIALTASFPIGGVVPTSTLLNWLRRTGLGTCVTVAMWGLVVLMDRREAAGNGLLTALALAIAAGGAVLVRARSLDESH